MRYEMTVRAFDVMDEIFIGVSVTAVDGFNVPQKERVLSLQTFISGSGEDDVAQWCRDALVGALEAM